MEAARSEARGELEIWKVQYEMAIRQDAILRSRAVTVGKVTEHIAPYLPEFGFNPKDARFIGSPIDLLVFDGMDEGNLLQIIFLEIKTGKSTLTPRQRQIRSCIEEGRIKWREMSVQHGATVLPLELNDDFDGGDVSLMPTS